MFEDGYINTMTVLCAVLWTAAGACLIAAWVTVFLMPAESYVPRLLAMTAVMLSIGALVAHMRRMTLRICALIRATRRDDPTELKVIR